jgi:hypothetical protein
MNLETSLAEIVAALLVPVFGYGLALLRKHMVRSTVLRAVARGAGEAYLVMLEQQRGVAGARSAVEAGADYVIDRVPAAMASAGVNGEDVRQMVRGELGKLLAADPGVKVGG